MACKIVFIGGGSYIWTPTFANDLFLREALNGSTLTLVDINEEALGVMLKYCRMLNAELNRNWKIESAEIPEALKDADFVCISIATGGLEAMCKDYTIPEEYGIFHAVGDSTGPGGISRTLRDVPVFLEIANQMNKICPQARLIHVTNPLSQLTRAVNKYSKIQAVGLCHNYTGTISMLSEYFNVPFKEINAVSVGINHFTWLKNLTISGKCVEDELNLDRYVDFYNKAHGHLVTNTTDDEIQKMLSGENMEYYFNFILKDLYGYFPIGSSNHIAEGLSYYCNNEETLNKYYIRRKGVLPRRQMLKDNKIHKINDIITGKTPIPVSHASNESFANIVEALHTGCPSRAIVTMANKGQISNLPKDVSVETWAEINGSGIYPLVSGDVPRGIHALVENLIEEQELAVEAAYTGDMKTLVKAMTVSPMVADKERAAELAARLVEANKEYLPQFK